MAMPDVEEMLAAQLVSAGLGTLGSSIVRGPVRASGVDDACIFVLAYDGEAPMPTMGGADAPDLRYPRVQIAVRGERSSYAGAKATARAVFSALHKRQPSGWVSIECGEGVYTGADDQNRHIIRINVRVGWYGAPQ